MKRSGAASLTVRLVLLALVPVLGVLVSTALIASRAGGDLERLRQLEEGTRASLVPAELAHALGVERDAGLAMVLRAPFAGDLPRARAGVDALLEQETRVGDESRLRTFEADLRALRRTVDDRSAEPATLMTGYATLEEETLRRIALLAPVAPSGDAATRAIAFARLVAAHVELGRERALLAGTLAGVPLTDNAVLDAAGASARATRLQAIFSELAPPPLAAEYADALASGPVRAAERWARSVRSAPEPRELGLEAGRWYELAVARRDELRAVENAVGTDLLEWVRGEVRAARRSVDVSLAVAVATVALTAIALLVVLRRLMVELGAEPDAVLRLAAALRDGDLTRAFGVTRVGSKARSSRSPRRSNRSCGR